MIAGSTKQIQVWKQIYEPDRPFMHLTDCCWFLTISGWGGAWGGGGESEGEKGDGGCVGSAVRKLLCPVKFSYRTAMPPPPPLRLTYGPRNPRVHKTTYAPMISTAPCVMFFDAGRSITWGTGRGGWHWKSRVGGPQMELGYRLDANSKRPTKLSISSANLPPTPPHQKHYARGRRNHRCINS
jgi:hypothetical protein